MAGLRRELISTLAATRISEARLCGLTYAPLRRQAGQLPARARLFTVERRIMRATESAPSAALLDLAAIVDLTAGKRDRAVAHLEKAVSLPGAGAVQFCDLGAAYLARAGSGAGRDLLRALIACARALSLDPSLPEARFNEALAVERLHLRGEARAAWQKYLQRDRDGDWAGEARAHLAALTAEEAAAWPAWRARLTAVKDDLAAVALVQRFPGEVRIYAEEELLGRWAQAQLDGDPRAAEGNLTVARRLGRALAIRNGDRLVADVVAAIDRAGSGLRQLAVGHRLFSRGVESEETDRCEAASPLFVRAESAFHDAQSPMREEATLHRAICAFYRPDYRTALALLTKLRRELDPVLYPTLLARSEWITGLVHFALGHLPEALDSESEAAARFEAAGELAHAGFLHSLIAADLQYLGQRDRAWDHRLKALAVLPLFDQPRRIFSVLWEAVEASLAEDDLGSASYLLRELVSAPGVRTTPEVRLESMIRGARVFARLGDSAAALRESEQAEALLPALPEGSFHRRAAADLAVSEGQIRLRTEPAEAIESLDSALAYYEGSGYRIESAEVLRARAAAHRQAGQTALATADLQRGLAEYERERQAIGSEQERRDYFAQAQALSDDLIAVQIAAGGGARMAFDTAERAHARSLLDAMKLGDSSALATAPAPARATPAGRPMEARAICQALPAGTTLIAYGVLEDRLIIWTLNHQDLQGVLVGVGAAALAERARACRRSVMEGARLLPGRTPFSALYNILIRPVAARLHGAERLIVIPDKVLGAVPFAALADSSGRPLVADFAVAVAPSATVFLRALGRDPPTARRPPRVLVVANDHADDNAFQGLPRLRALSRETASIAALYPSATILQGEAATPASFTAAAPGYDLIHVGSHALINAEHPDFSALLLAPRRAAAGRMGDSGALFARDLYKLRFDRTRLVVLAACSTAQGNEDSREGALSLARPFLAGGAAAVVASLWPVDDEASAPFFEAFYRRLRAGDDALRALRAAQLTLLGASDPRLSKISSWAAFQLTGGVRPSATPLLNSES